MPLLSVASTVENFTIVHLTLARIKAINERFGEAMQLLDYVHSVLESGCHQRFLAQVCREKMRLHLLQNNAPRALAIAIELGLEPLTDREIEILKPVARGLSNPEIGARSRSAVSTAKWHLKNVFAKLDVSTRTGAIARARELQCSIDLRVGL